MTTIAITFLAAFGVLVASVVAVIWMQLRAQRELLDRLRERDESVWTHIEHRASSTGAPLGKDLPAVTSERVLEDGSTLTSDGRVLDPKGQPLPVDLMDLETRDEIS